MLLILFTLFNQIILINTLIGFDCGLNTMNTTTISILGPDECNLEENDLEIKNHNIILYQITEFKYTKIIQCKITLKRTVQSCEGWFQYTKPIHKAEVEFIVDITHEECVLIHTNKTYTYNVIYNDKHIINEIQPNGTTVAQITLAGNANNNHCNGRWYEDRFGEYNKVFAHGYLTISTSDYYAPIDIENNKIKLNLGTYCPFKDNSCINLEGHTSFWDTIPETNCVQDKFEILYQGPATKIFNKRDNEKTYTVQSNETTFALKVKEIEIICNKKLFKTEHPRLLIQDIENEHINVTKIIHKNIDLYTYVNSKFVFVEKHIGTQIEILYKNIVTHMCEIEKKLIQSILTLAFIAPDHFAYNIMNKPGYMAKLVGEAVQISKCSPVEVTLLSSDNCFEELQVSRQNETWYLLPKTHILTKYGTPIDCDKISPQYYKLDEQWYKIMPHPTETFDVHKIRTKSSSYKYKNIQNLMTKGIYSQKDIDQHQESTMFPINKATLVNNIARTITQARKRNTQAKISILADQAWNDWWNSLFSFRSTGSVMIIITSIIYLISKFTNLFGNIYLLYNKFGLTKHILGAIFSSITHILLDKKRRDIDIESATTRAYIQPHIEKLYSEIPIRNKKAYQTGSTQT